MTSLLVASHWNRCSSPALLSSPPCRSSWFRLWPPPGTHGGSALFGGSFGGELGGHALHQTLCLPGLYAAQIAWLLVLLGLVRVVSEAIRAKLSPWLQLGSVPAFRGKLLGDLLRLEQSSLLCWPRGDLASRVQVEIDWLRTLLLGSHPGHSGRTDGYCSGHCGAEGGYYASQPGVRLRSLAVAAIVFAPLPARISFATRTAC